MRRLDQSSTLLDVFLWLYAGPPRRIAVVAVVAALIGASLNAMQGTKPFLQYFVTGLMMQVLCVIVALIIALNKR